MTRRKMLAVGARVSTPYGTGRVEKIATRASATQAGAYAVNLDDERAHEVGRGVETFFAHDVTELTRNTDPGSALGGMLHFGWPRRAR